MQNLLQIFHYTLNSRLHYSKTKEQKWYLAILQLNQNHQQQQGHAQTSCSQCKANPKL
jgi:hypothetical protein